MQEKQLLEHLEICTDALSDAWSLVQEMCFHNPPGCENCSIRCRCDAETDQPIEEERITDESDQNYWRGCQYDEIPETLRKVRNFLH